MQNLAKAVLALAFVSTVGLGGATPVKAQYYYPPPSTYNGCPPGYTVQGGVCKPYRGPVGGGWDTSKLPTVADVIAANK